MAWNKPKLCVNNVFYRKKNFTLEKNNNNILSVLLIDSEYTADLTKIINIVKVYIKYQIYRKYRHSLTKKQQQHVHSKLKVTFISLFLLNSQHLYFTTDNTLAPNPQKKHQYLKVGLLLISVIIYIAKKIKDMKANAKTFSDTNASSDSLPIHNDEYERKWKGKNKQGKIAAFFAKFVPNSTNSREAKKHKKRVIFYSLLISLFFTLFGLVFYLSSKNNYTSSDLFNTIDHLIKPLKETNGLTSNFKDNKKGKIGGLQNIDETQFDIEQLIEESKDKSWLYALGLDDKEYYDHDFRNLDIDSVNKFDKGARHFLITNEAEIYSSEDNKKALELELEMLLASSVESYDLYDFKGDPDGVNNRDHVLFLVPLRNAEAVLPLMFRHLMNLTYPHELIDLGFLVSDCSPEDKTLETLVDFSLSMQNGTLINILEKLPIYTEADTLHLSYMHKNYLNNVDQAFSPPYHMGYTKPFRSIQIFDKNFGQVIGQGFSDRHAVKVQGVRRKLMGRARNWLVSNTLKPYHSWVYWRDVDVELCPGSVIQDLMKHNYDVIVPNVWRPLPSFLGSEQPYDLNSWIESPPALELAKTLDEDDVIVEGYAEYPTWRVHLANLRNADGNPDDLIDLDGVGGVSILAKAKVFRSGINFPAHTFENHAETEAFGKMARKSGFKVGGLPHYVLWHIYEPSEDDLREMANREREKRRD
mgnify:FL=1